MIFHINCHEKEILRENYEFFKEENKNVNLSRSPFAELRPVFVIPKAALAHRNCLCVYHENICLLLKSLDKYVGGNYCSSLETFTIVCWNFFATSHGKGVVDGIGGVVKRLVWSAILPGDVCRSVEDFIKLARKKTDKIIVTEINIDEIQKSKIKLENLFKTAKSVPETQKVHYVKVVNENELEVSYYSMCAQRKSVKY
ncbi:unnamed protein product [Rotaria socialis]|nr:unnamed protein product [Rotaria socialis]